MPQDRAERMEEVVEEVEVMEEEVTEEVRKWKEDEERDEREEEENDEKEKESLYEEKVERCVCDLSVLLSFSKEALCSHCQCFLYDVCHLVLEYRVCGHRKSH